MATEIQPELEKLSEEVPGEEKKIPVFTVLKNNAILKNIFLIDSPPSVSNSERNSSAVSEEALVVGRHPDCNITLEHPSISRFHLRIHSIPSLHSLSVFDLSSAHGTWVSGKKVEPGVRVELHEGDLLQLGGSTRAYRLHWVPLSRAYDMKNPFVPPLSESESVHEMLGETCQHLDDDGLHLPDDESETQGDYFEGLDLLFSDMNMKSPMRQLTAYAPLMLEDTRPPFYLEEDAENKSSFQEILQLSEIAETQPVWKLGEGKGNLEWTALTCADGMNSSNVPAFDKPGPVEEVQKKILPVVIDDGLSLEDVQTQTPSDCYDCLDLLFADIYNMISPEQKLTPPASLDIKSPLSFEEDAENKVSFIETLQQSETAIMNPALQLDKVNRELLVDFSSTDVQTLPHAEDVESPPVASHITCGLSIWNLKPTLHLDKVNSEPQVDFPSADVHTLPQAEDVESPPVASHLRSGSSIWKRRGKSASVQVQTGRSRQKCTKASTNLEMELEKHESSSRRSHLEGQFEGADLVEEVVFTPDKESRAPDILLSNRLSKQKGGEKMKHKLSLNSLLSSTDEEGEEAFTPDKENMTPKTHLLWSTKKMGKLDEINHPKLYRSSPLKNVGSKSRKEVCMPAPSESPNHFRKLFQEKTCDHSSSSSLAKSEADILNVREQRMPFQSLLVNSNKTTSEAVDAEGSLSGHKSVGNIQIRESTRPCNNSSKGESKMWTMVVDTACLLNKESRKALQLMQGLRGTSLIIPRIVIRELDCMNKHCYLFRRNTEVSSALQWIKDCMVDTKWWIHVQSSAEDAEPIAPTPRSWPLPQMCREEKKEKFSASSVPFSPFGRFQDIATPTTKDHILDCALFFRNIRQKGRQFVLLSDDLSLKIKAMAEGLLCETAEEFRESLVNPFSERFLWSESSPRGPTWSCSDDAAVLREKFFNVPSSKHLKLGEAATAKGLKLILLHNSHYRQISTVS